MFGGDSSGYQYTGSQEQPWWQWRWKWWYGGTGAQTSVARKRQNHRAYGGRLASSPLRHTYGLEKPYRIIRSKTVLYFAVLVPV